MDTIPLSSLRWPGRVLGLAFAFFAGCPVFANLVGTYIADGQSFAVTAAIACTMLLLAIAAAARLGIPAGAVSALRGPLLALAGIGAVFWAHWTLVNILSPSPQPMMRYQVFQALIWMIVPLALFTLWRRSIDTDQVIRFIILIHAAFVIGLLVRWGLGLGRYQSGRWHAGLSLEAIRCGRYSTMALWVFVLACLCPARVVPARLKLVALACMPVAVLMMVAANARGPWLSLAVAVAVTCIPLGRLLAAHIGRDVRVLAGMILAAAVVTAFVASQVASVESDFDRLFTLTRDGGSAEGRVTLLHDHLQMLRDAPQAVLSGFGYEHGLFYPHNVLIEALVDGGLISLLLLLAMIAVTFHAWLVRSPRGDVPCLLVAGLFVLSLTGNQVSGSIATDLTWFYPVLLALAIDRGEMRQRASQGGAGTALDAARSDG